MSALETLWEHFDRLAVPSEGAQALALEVTSGAPHLLTRGASGEPVFLIETTARTHARAPARLKHVNVDFESTFEIRVSGLEKVRTATYCRMRCLPESSWLHRTFVDAVGTVIAPRNRKLSETEVDELIDSLLNMFRAARLASQRTVAGLWGELLLIYAAAEPAVLVDAWRDTPTAPFDFSLGDRWIEVKASQGGLRVHDFSLVQSADTSGAVLLASILLRADTTGCTVMQLARELCAKLDAERQAKVWRTVVTTLGTEVEWIEDAAFDVPFALQNLRLVSADFLPSPHVSESDAPYIRSVRFTADVTALVALHGRGVDDVLRTNS